MAESVCLDCGGRTAQRGLRCSRCQKTKQRRARGIRPQKIGRDECIEEGCTEPQHARKRCSRHYSRERYWETRKLSGYSVVPQESAQPRGHWQEGPIVTVVHWPRAKQQGHPWTCPECRKEVG